jgi:hypothetical protein
MKRGVAAFVVAAVLISAGAFAVYLTRDACVDFFPVHDSAATVAQESSQLLASVRNTYEQGRYVAHTEPLVRPVRVESISGKTATLQLTGPMYGGNLQYAQAWQHVYAEHHPPGGQCATLRIVWPSGQYSQRCCRADL